MRIFDKNKIKIVLLFCLFASKQRLKLSICKNPGPDVYLVLKLFYGGGPAVYFRENYNFQRFQGERGWSNMFQGVQLLIPMETYRTCDLGQNFFIS